MPRRNDGHRPPAADKEMRSLYKGLGPAIEALRIMAGLSRTELARRSELGRSTVLKLEKGERYPSPETLAQLAQGLEVSVDAILTAGWVAAEPDKEKRQMRASELGAAISPKLRATLPWAAGGAALGAAPIAIPTILAGAAAGMVAGARLAKTKNRVSDPREETRFEILKEIHNIEDSRRLNQALDFVRQLSGHSPGDRADHVTDG